jgi:hypothetical protein
MLGSSGVVVMTVLAWADTGYSMLDTGRTGVVVMTVLAWADTGYSMLDTG